ncbi:MAG: hypothetical protein ABIF10_01520 [Candidatus Woesearchaeota archaeon]
MNRKLVYSIFIVVLSIIGIAQYNEEYDIYPCNYSDYISYSDASFYSDSDPSLWRPEYVQYEYVNASNIPELSSDHLQYAVTNGKLNEAQYSAITSEQASSLISDFRSDQFKKLSESAVQGLSEADAKAYYSQRFEETEFYHPSNDNEFLLLSKISAYGGFDMDSMKGRDDVSFGTTPDGQTYFVSSGFGFAYLEHPHNVSYTDNGLLVGEITLYDGYVKANDKGYLFGPNSMWSTAGGKFTSSGETLYCQNCESVPAGHGTVVNKRQDADVNELGISTDGGFNYRESYDLQEIPGEQLHERRSPEFMLEADALGIYSYGEFPYSQEKRRIIVSTYGGAGEFTMYAQNTNGYWEAGSRSDMPAVDVTGMGFADWGLAHPVVLLSTDPENSQAAKAYEGIQGNGFFAAAARGASQKELGNVIEEYERARQQTGIGKATFRDYPVNDGNINIIRKYYVP